MTRKKRGSGYPRRSGMNPALYALRQQRSHESGWDLLGSAAELEKRGDLEPARELYKRILERNKTGRLGDLCVTALLRVSVARWDHTQASQDLHAGIRWAEEDVRRHPGGAEQHWRLAGLYEIAGQYTDALRLATATAALDPRDVSALVLQARAHLCLGDVAAGQRSYERAAILLDGAPMSAGSPDDRLAYQEALLITGRLSAGWRERDDALYEYAAARNPTVRLALDRSRWDGAPIAGRLLVNVEGGRGDAFQMARWIPLVRDRVGSLRLVVKPELVEFFAGQPWDAEVIPTSGVVDPTSFERWTGSWRLPTFFDSEDIPPAPYLWPPDSFRPLAGGLKVGLVWQGNIGHQTYRATRLADWAPVLAVQGCSFYSLQIGPAAAQLGECGAQVEDLSPELTRWTRTAAAMAELDLIIGVDTAVTNLAGALGRPLWVCLAAAPDWRWMLGRSDTPWYGSARLFRQPRAGDWRSVFEEIAAELRRLVPASV